MSFPLVIGDATMPGSREEERAADAMGDEEFRAFYERTARPLWAYLSRMTGDRAAADDLLQETYYRFYRAAAKYENESHRRNSLFRIATNLVRDAARKRHRSGELMNIDEPGAEPRSRASTPEERVAAKTDLSRAMRQLDPTQREILWLAYGQGASHEEIAGIVGVRAISVRTLLIRAKRKLAAILEGRHSQRATSSADRSIGIRERSR